MSRKKIVCHSVIRIKVVEKSRIYLTLLSVKYAKMRSRINIKFCKDIEEEIASGNCLSDMAINLAQLVIHKQFLSINGLEHTELGLTKLFSIKKGKFLQILFGDYHWITVCGSNEAKVSV